jgi:hypothetical protein
MGRTPILEERDLIELRNEVHESTLALGSPKCEFFKQRIQEKARESLLRRKLDPNRASDLSHTTINRYLRFLDLVTIKKPKAQNQRRFEVREKISLFLKIQVFNDVRTGISAAALFQAVLGQEGEGNKPVASTMFNVDVTSFEMNNGGSQPIFVTREALEELEQKCLSPNFTEDKLQRRGCSLMTLVSAAGTLDAAIVTIRDETVVAHQLHKVLQSSL